MQWSKKWSINIWRNVQLSDWNWHSSNSIQHWTHLKPMCSLFAKSFTVLGPDNMSRPKFNSVHPKLWEHSRHSKANNIFQAISTSIMERMCWNITLSITKIGRAHDVKPRLMLLRKTWNKTERQLRKNSYQEGMVKLKLNFKNERKRYMENDAG